jgi:hypothetical protein
MEVTIEKVLDFENGDLSIFNIKNVRKLIADDVKLTNTFKDLTDAEAEAKLFKMVLIYNDRNKVYID